MYVKSLRLVGFKSFADRTRLEFEPGVTVVVGPNGSGKSNLVDAIAWVMGTQSTRSLRTQRMDDVIFAGTTTRPAFGRAEVTLVLDNSARTIPLDLDEISITRRLYRDGASDYQINGVDCRLLDIQELLSDGGVGRHQHLIVGQGRIDDLLNAKPEDHRAVIEEAAGILKHRLRKERSVRRLERTDADVLRLQDILRELKRQIRPLERQAKSADRHAVLRREVRELRLFFGGEAMRAVHGRLAELEGAETQWRAKLEAAQSERAELESRLPELISRAGAAGHALEADTAAAARLETTVERLRRIAQVAHERRRSAQARLEGAGERRRDLEAEAAELGADLAGSGATVIVARRDAERAEQVFRDLEDEARSLAEQGALPVEGVLAVVRGDLRSLEAAVDRDEREARDLGRRLDVLTARVAEESAEIDELQDAIRDADQATGPAQEAYERSRHERERLQQQWERAEEQAGRAQLMLAGAEARSEAMAEAMADSVARERVLARTGMSGSLTALLAVPPDWVSAVDAALGPWAGGIVARSRRDIEEAAVDLKADGLGGIPMVTAGTHAPASPARDVGARWGIEALVDLLGPGADQDLAGQLLGDVVVVEGWATAWEIVAHHPHVRAVTPEGDLVDANGMRIAQPDGATPAMLETALAALEDAEIGAARAESLLTSTKRAFDGARRVERDALEVLEALEAKLGGMTEALRMSDRARTAAENEIERLEERRSLVVEAAGDREARIERLRARLADLEGEEAERERAWEQMAQRRREVELRREQANHARQEAAAALGAILERRRMLEDRLRVVTGELQSAVVRPVDPAHVMRLQVIEDQSAKALEVVRAHLATLRERQRALRREAGEAGARLETARARLEEVRNVLETARQEISAIAVETAELRVREESVAEGLRRDADASVEEALDMPRPDIDEDLESLLASHEAELRRLGPVNPLAAQEYRELQERYDFLAAQLDDLASSRAELRKVISALDDRIVEEFTAAFQEVARYYEEYFGVLFPGGKGRLRLVDGSDPLTSGVEVEAMPLGKKVSRLSLLSGGERSLAALAFLFSVFRARPGPFYILDEVEAALDDANLRRFLRLVDRFRERAQLLIVTHQQQTMEVADILYGVTLERGGSSQVLSRRIRERSQLA
ncbi:MAG: chromosome segregation protein SMC [Gammaproteobacteria bacterium]|nr:chromosome segregation protein SMC [Gammaproteobacteria bacterium]